MTTTPSSAIGGAPSWVAQAARLGSGTARLAACLIALAIAAGTAAAAAGILLSAGPERYYLAPGEAR